MVDLDLETIKKLREETGTGIMECKKALQESGGDFDQAKEIVNQRAKMKAEKRADREAGEGVVQCYVHSNRKVGALVSLKSETDFVARGEGFQELAKEIAMQVCAMNPKDKEELLNQEWIRDPKKTIRKLIQEEAARTKENVELGSFFRVEID